MKERQGKVYIQGELYKNRYDRNEAYGFDGKKSVQFFEIAKELFFGKYKITVSRFKELEYERDFMQLAFDPPKEEPNGKRD